MTNLKNDVDYMTKYLEHAFTFEKQVYLWTQAMNTVNSQVQRVYEQKKEASENQIDVYLTTETAEIKVNEKIEEQEKRIKKFTIVNKILLPIAIVLFLLILIATIIISSVSSSATFIESIVLGFYFAFSSGLVPASIIILVISNIKIKNAKNRIEKLSNKDSLEKYKDGLNNTAKNINKQLLELEDAENALTAQQDNIFKLLNEAKATRTEIYNINVLPEKYRNINAVSAMYEYLKNGQCNTIQGHGGIYDTYEHERILLEQLYQMILMNQKLDRIEHYQRLIYTELTDIHSILESMKFELSSIGKSLGKIEVNSAISAQANQQSANRLSWIAWNEWSKN